VTRNFREVSDRVLRGEGVLGTLVSSDSDGPAGDAIGDFRAAMANLRIVTERLNAGEGTIGGLLADPAVYENLASFLEGAQRSFLLRALIRSSLGSTGPAAGAAAPPGR
jgi:phospholipid/cholesterol/gamma-HCH transport system substrate-binding protein